MSGTSEAPRRPKLPWGVIGMIPLVLAVESYVGRHDLEFMSDPLILSWRVGADAAVKEAKKAEVLCFGDSLVRLGIMPRILEAKLGKSAYNLASPGSPASASYFLLRRRLRSGSRPQAIVVDFHSNVLTNPPRTTTHFWADLLTVGDTLDLSWNAHDHRLLLSTTLALALPTYRRRDGLREEVLARLRGEARPSRELIAAHRRNIQANLGASPHPKRTPIPDDPTTGESVVHWKPYAVNADYVKRFLKLAASERIPVFWLVPPLSPGRQERLERRGVDRGYMEFVQAMQKQFTNVVVIDGRHADYPADVFIDPTHLDKQGATELSTAVASVLEAGLKNPGSLPRTVAIRSFQRGVPEPALEDLDQSRDLVRSNGDRIVR